MKFLISRLVPINIFSLGGLILVILGFLLIPLFIGLPLIIIGLILLIGAILSHLLNFFPGGKFLKQYLKSKIKKQKIKN